MRRKGRGTRAGGWGRGEEPGPGPTLKRVQICPLLDMYCLTLRSTPWLRVYRDPFGFQRMKRVLLSFFDRVSFSLAVFKKGGDGRLPSRI